MKFKRKRVDNMGAVLSLKSHVNKKDKKIQSYSIIDLILDPKKRKEYSNYYDSKYQESDDEKDIFESWQDRYRKGCE